MRTPSSFLAVVNALGHLPKAPLKAKLVGVGRQLPLSAGSRLVVGLTRDRGARDEELGLNQELAQPVPHLDPLGFSQRAVALPATVEVAMMPAIDPDLLKKG